MSPLSFEAIRILRDNMSLSRPDIAAHLGVSFEWIDKCLKKESGRTIHQWRHHLRLEASVDQLLKTQKSTESIAQELGFSSNSHFISSFKQEVDEQMRNWQHSGFSFDQSVYLSAHDRSGIERLVQYIVRCPFSLSRLIKVTDDGMVTIPIGHKFHCTMRPFGTPSTIQLYKSEKQKCRSFPNIKSDTLKAGTNRNFQILSAMDFLAEFTQHSTQGFTSRSILWVVFK